MCPLSVLIHPGLPPLPPLTLPIPKHPKALSLPSCFSLPLSFGFYPLLSLFLSLCFFFFFSLLCSVLSFDSSFILVCPLFFTLLLPLPPSGLPSHHLACAILVSSSYSHLSQLLPFPSPISIQAPFSAFLLFSSSFLWHLSSTLPFSFFLSFLVLSLLCSFLSSDSSFILVCPLFSPSPSRLFSSALALIALIEDIDSGFVRSFFAFKMAH